MRFGLHVSIGKGLAAAVSTAHNLGCDAFQVFIGNPRGWKRTPLVEAEVLAFQEAVQQYALGPIAVHLSYLPNPAAEDENLYEKSIAAIAEEYQRAVTINADFFVVHPGKAGQQALETALTKVAMGVREILSHIHGRTLFLLENQAGAGTEVGGDFRQLATILKKIDLPDRTGICLDTCHAFAAGYELRNQAGINALFAELETTVGLSNVPLLHLNDALGAKGAHRDRHTHIGEGQIGEDGFRCLLTDPRVSGLCGILETPRDEPADDQKNLAVLRRLVTGGTT